MPGAMIVYILIALVWLLVCLSADQWLDRRRLSTPLLAFTGGALASLLVVDELNTMFDAPVVEHVVEVVLALLLFVDAIEVRGGLLGDDPALTGRLLGIAFPLSLLLAFGLGLLLLPELPWAAVIVMVCIAIPTDFAHSAGILRSPHISARVRNALNVESGYNDGIVAPLFVFALSVVELHATPVEELLLEAVRQSAVAIVVGIGTGLLSGWAVRYAMRTEITSAAAVRTLTVLVPLVTYTISAPLLNANGFVAAFVAGIAYRWARAGRRTLEGVPHRETLFADDLGRFASLALWFLFGGLALLVLSNEFDLGLLLFAALALTLIRLVPVVLATLGTTLEVRERVQLGLLGPRGTASIVFGLLAFTAFPDDMYTQPFYAMALVVGGSIVLHTLLAPRGAPDESVRTGSPGAR